MSLINKKSIIKTFSVDCESRMNQKTIAIFALPEVQLLDIAGPMDVFSEANRQIGKDVYKTILITSTDEPLQTCCGLRLLPDYTIHSNLPRIDTFLIAGSPFMVGIQTNQMLIKRLTEVCSSSRRFGSICTGTFLLAKTNLLVGREVTTHWAFLEQLKVRYPDLNVNHQAFCVQDKNMFTSAGVTSGLDLALTLIEQDLGAELARKTAMHLVTLFKRQGTQQQFSDSDGPTSHGKVVLNDLSIWAKANLKQPINTNILAEKLGITTRHLSRIFSKEFGVSPAKWLENIRLEHAKKLLREDQLATKQVVMECGLSNEQVLRQLFVRNLGISPVEYKKLYQYKL